MDLARIRQIDCLLFRRMLKEKKLTLNEKSVNDAINMGVKIGIEHSIMRAFTAEVIVDLANATFGGVHIFQVTSNVTKVSPELRMEIECKMFAEYFRSRRLRIDKHMVQSYVIECTKVGITNDEATEYVAHKLNGLLAEAMS